ncbi:MAG: hypothetical protein GQ474_08050 [Sulfurimonas sp.]|nr:hypothetical protein [Sulfurimonas sp.]
MKTALLILFSLLVSTTLHAEEWTTTQKSLLAADLALIAVDWKQTHYIAAHPHHTELNPIINHSLSKKRVDIYFATATIGTIAIAHLLPEYRTQFLQGVFVVQLFVTQRNYGMGIKASF